MCVVFLLWSILGLWLGFELLAVGFGIVGVLALVLGRLQALWWLPFLVFSVVRVLRFFVGFWDFRSRSAT